MKLAAIFCKSVVTSNFRVKTNPKINFEDRIQS
jgi:hypothetical protein